MFDYLPFKQARPVWAVGLETEKNITIGLHTAIRTEATNAILRVATSGFYRVYINDTFLFYGPARCAHGFFRVDEVPISLPAGDVHIALEVVNYFVNSFGYIRQPGFIQAEIAVGDSIIAATGGQDFEIVRLTERVQRVQRYSYQRPFAESYRLTPDYTGWRMGRAGANAVSVNAVETSSKTLVPRRIPLNTFPVSPMVCREAFGTVKQGVRPTVYLKDRSLTGILDPENGSIEGFFEQELEQHLTDDVQELVCRTFTKEGTAYEGTTHLQADDFEILSLACEKTGFITTHIYCQQAGTLLFMFDEVLTDDGDVDPLRMECCNVLRLEMQPGEYHFQTMEPYGFRYIKPVCLSGIFTIDSLSVTETICPQPFIKTYTGQDPMLASVFEAARESFLQNSFDLFMDCPTRERAGWLCDSFFTARVEWEFTGANVIEKNFLENFLLPQSFPCLPEGMLPMCYPADHSDGLFIPNWAMWFVLELADRMRRVGDREFIDAFRPRVYALLDWFKQYENADGLLEKLSGWIFLEWSKANELVYDINFPTNMLYAFMLEEAAFLFDDKELSRKATALKDLIRTRSFDGTFFVDNEIYRDGVPIPTGERTETCQYYAFFTGVATPETYPMLWRTMLTEFGPDRLKSSRYADVYPADAFIGNYLRLMMLEKADQYSQLKEEIKGYFYYMAQRTGTLWENIDSVVSCNHGFASYAAHFVCAVEDADIS